MVEFGKFRHRISIQEMTDGTADDYNQTTKTASTVATRWAQITPLSGKQLEYAQRIHDQVTHEIRLRYYAGLGPDHRVLFGSRVFEILNVINVDERKEEMIVQCVEEP